MKKTMLALLVTAITWTSCMKDNSPQPLSQKQIKQKVDSIMADKTKMLEVYGQKDLKNRLKIEVKVKADSIVNARMNATAKDTAKTTKITNQPKHQ